MTLQELEADIIRRVFDESFLNEKLLTKLLHAYAAAIAAQERERCAQVAYDYAAKQEGASDYWAFAAATSIAAAIRALE